MKRKLLLVFAIGVGTLSYGQCTLEGPEPSMCLMDAPVTLSSDAAGAVFSGPGVSGGVFSPAAAGVGTHTISLVAPGVGYSVEDAIIYDPISIEDGTIAAGLGDDNVVGSFPLGFSFNFFGTDYTDFYIGSNGFLTFSSGMPSGCCSGQNLPNASTPNNLIAFAWEDLNATYGGVVRYKTIGVAPNRICIVEFNNYKHYYYPDGIDPVFAHIQMYESTNCIEVHIGAQPQSSVHTLGIENATGREAYTAPGKNASSWTATDYAVRFCQNTGCETSIEVEVTAGPEVNGAVDNSSICFGEEITLTASGSLDEYVWGRGIVDGEAFAPATPGEKVFIVSGTDEDGCTSTDAVNVMVNAVPYIFAGDDAEYCANEEIVLEAYSALSGIVWDNGVVDGEAFMQDPGTVVYTATVTDPLTDCSNESSVTIVSNEMPTGTGVVTMSAYLYDGSIDFTPSGGTGGPYTFLWSNEATTEDIMGIGTGTYTVKVSDGRCESRVTFEVDSQLGIAKNEIDNLSIYPNPVVNEFTIDLAAQYNWLIYDNVGKIISAGSANGLSKVSMENVATGTYFIQVTSNDEVSVVTLVKE